MSMIPSGLNVTQRIILAQTPEEINIRKIAPDGNLEGSRPIKPQPKIAPASETIGTKINTHA